MKFDGIKYVLWPIRAPSQSRFPEAEEAPGGGDKHGGKLNLRFKKRYIQAK